MPQLSSQAGGFPSYSDFLFSWLDKTYPHSGGLSALLSLPIQKYEPHSRNPHTHILRIMSDQMSGNPVAQSIHENLPYPTGQVQVEVSFTPHWSQLYSEMWPVISTLNYSLWLNSICL